MAKKQLNDDDRNLWDKVTESVQPLLRQRFFARPNLNKPSPAPLGGKAKKAASKKDSRKVAPPLSPSARIKPSPSGQKIHPANLDHQGYGGISRSSARSIKSGQTGYSRYIDLHGCHREEAYIRLKSFIQSSVNEGHRNVLVITGKGVAGKGVIRSHLTSWLNEAPLSTHVIAFCQAQPKDGGAGAWYVNLRRK